MLVLTRKLGEKIAIGNEITVVVTQIQGNHVKLGVEAPKEISIYREEVLAKTIRQNRNAAAANLKGLETLLSNKNANENENREGDKESKT